MQAIACFEKFQYTTQENVKLPPIFELPYKCKKVFKRIIKRR